MSATMVYLPLHSVLSDVVFMHRADCPKVERLTKNFGYREGEPIEANTITEALTHIDGRTKVCHCAR